MRDAGGDAIGVDWRVPLDARVGAGRRTTAPIQGNLDPAVLRRAVGRGRARRHRGARRAAKRDGHVFNLGHGVLPATPVENLSDSSTSSTRTDGSSERDHRSACS